jgi:hypothetical protein
MNNPHYINRIQQQQHLLHPNRIDVRAAFTICGGSGGHGTVATVEAEKDDSLQGPSPESFTARSWNRYI